MNRLIGLSMMLVALATGAGTALAAPTPPPQAQGALKTADGQTIGNVLLT